MIPSHHSPPNSNYHYHSSCSDDIVMTDDDPPAQPQQLPSASSLFHQLVPDCRKLILSFHYHEIEDADLPSRQQDNFSPEYLSQLQFIQRYFSCEATLDSDSNETDLSLLTNLHSLRLAYDFELQQGLHILGRFRKLKKLQFHDNGALRDETFQHLESLEVLSIAGMHGPAFLTDSLFTHLKHLKSLNFSHCKSLTDRAFENLLKAGSKLEKLKLQRCPQMTDGVFSFLRGGSLREVVLFHCDKMTGEGLQHLRGVEMLSFNEMRRVKCREAFKCLEGSAHSLKITASTVSSFDDEAMSRLKGISRLELRGARDGKLTDAAFSHLAGSIKRLEIQACRNIGFLTKNMLWHLSGIEHIMLCDTGIRIEVEDLPRVKKVFGNVITCEIASDFADESVLEELKNFINARGGVFDTHDPLVLTPAEAIF